MTIKTVEDNLINLKINQKQYNDYQDLLENKDNTDLKDALSSEMQDLYAISDQKGVLIKFEKTADDVYELTDETKKALADLNIKYKDNALASSLYVKGLKAQEAASAGNIKNKQADTAATKANTEAVKENAAARKSEYATDISSLINKKNWGTIDKKQLRMYDQASAAQDQAAMNAAVNGMSAKMRELILLADELGVKLEFEKTGKNQYGFTDETKKNLEAATKAMDANTASQTKNNVAEEAGIAIDKAAAAATEQTVAAEMASAAATNTSTAVTKKGMVATAMATVKDKAHNAILYAKAGAYKAAGAAANFFNIKSLAGIKTLAAGMLQMVAFTAVLQAVSTGIEKIWNKVPTKNHIKEWADESAQSLSELRDELDSIKEEIDSTTERIAELESKGALSLSDQQELQNLRLQNAELERQYAIKQKLEEQGNKDTTTKSMNYLKSYTGADSSSYYGGGSAWNDNGTIAEQIQKYTELYTNAQKELASIDENDKDAAKQWEEKNKQVTQYSNKLSELIEEASTYTDNIDPNLLTSSDLGIYNSIINAITNSLVSTGDMNVMDALSSSMSEAEFKTLQSKMQDLAEQSDITEQSIRNAIGDKLIQKCELAGISIDALKEHIMSLQNAGDVVSKILSEDAFKDSDIQKKINDMIFEEEFTINADSVIKVLGEDFVNACEKAGLSSDELINYLKSLQDEINNVSFNDSLTEIAGLEDVIGSANDAIQEFSENGGKVATETLQSLSEAFSSMEGTSEFTDMMQTLSDSSSSIAEVESAVTDLVEAYLSSTDVLSNLTEETKGLYISKLQEMGITNAQTLVEYKLAAAKLTNKDATEAEKNTALQHIDALMQENNELYANAAASLEASDKMALFTAYQEMAAGNNFASVVNSHAQSLLNVASAAGPAAGALKSYVETVMAIAQWQGNLSNVKSVADAIKFGAQGTSLIGKLGTLSNSAKSQFLKLTNPSTKFSYTPAGSGSSSSGSSGSSGSGGSSGSTTSASENRKNKYDEAKAELDHQLEMNYISYKTYYSKLVKLGQKYLKNKKGNLDDWKDHLETLSDVRRSAFEEYKSDLDKKFDDGKISYTTYFNELVKLENKWYKGFKSNADDLAEAIEERFDRMYEYFKDRMSDLEDVISDRDLFKTWSPGKSEVDVWKDYIDEIDNALNSHKLEWADWYKLRREAEEKLLEAQKSYYETQKQNIDDLIELTSDMLKQEREDMIDALEKQKDLFGDIVDAKKEALDLTRDQLDYEKEIRDLNKDLSELQAKAAVLRLDDSREGQAKYAAIMEEIRLKQEEIAEKQDDHALDATKEALDEALEKYEEKIEEKIEDIEELMNNQGEWLKYVYSYINNTDPSALLSQLTAYNDKYGTGIAADVNNIWKNYQDVVGRYRDMQIEDIIALLREQNDKIEYGSSEIDVNGDGVPDSSENYDTISKIISQMRDNVAAMKAAKASGDKATYDALKQSNLELSKQLSSISSGTYWNLQHPTDYTWTTQAGTNIFDMISSKGRTGAAIVNLMKNATSAAERNELAKELREVSGYQDLFYDQATGNWYKNIDDYMNQKALVSVTGTENDFPINSVSQVIQSIKSALESGNIVGVKKLVTALQGFSGYSGAWYDPYTKHVYKSALDFYNMNSVDAGKIGTGTAGASKVIGAMKNSGSTTVNRALAEILRTKFNSYKDLAWNSTAGHWQYTKNGQKVNLYHTGLQAGFVSDGSYLPTPKQNELYALLQKGELVLNKDDQSRLMLQMQVLSSMKDTLKNMTTNNIPDVSSAQNIILNVEAPVVVNGSADATVIDALSKHADVIADKSLEKLQNAMDLRGFSVKKQTSARKK